MQAYILRIYQPYFSQQPEVHPSAAPSNGHDMLPFITWTCKGPPPASGMGCAVALQALKQLQAVLSGVASFLEAQGAFLSQTCLCRAWQDPACSLSATVMQQGDAERLLMLDHVGAARCSTAEKIIWEGL